MASEDMGKLSLQALLKMQEEVDNFLVKVAEAIEETGTIDTSYKPKDRAKKGELEQDIQRFYQEGSALAFAMRGEVDTAAEENVELKQRLDDVVYIEEQPSTLLQQKSEIETRKQPTSEIDPEDPDFVLPIFEFPPEEDEPSQHTKNNRVRITSRPPLKTSLLSRQKKGIDLITLIGNMQLLEKKLMMVATAEFLKEIEALAKKSHEEKRVGSKALVGIEETLMKQGEKLFSFITRELQQILEVLDPEARKKIEGMTSSTVSFEVRGGERDPEDKLKVLAKELELLNEKLTAAYREIAIALDQATAPVEKIDIITLRKQTKLPERHAIEEDLPHPYPEQSTIEIEQQATITSGKVPPVTSVKRDQTTTGSLKQVPDESQQAVVRVSKGEKVQQAGVVHPKGTVEEQPSAQKAHRHPVILDKNKAKRIGSQNLRPLTDIDLFGTKLDKSWGPGPAKLQPKSNVVLRKPIPGKVALGNLIDSLDQENRTYLDNRASKAKGKRGTFLSFQIIANREQKMETARARSKDFSLLFDELRSATSEKQVAAVKNTLKKMIEADLKLDKKAHGFAPTGQVREKLNEALTKIEHFEESYPFYKELSRREQKLQKILQVALTEGQHAIKGKKEFLDLEKTLKTFQEQIKNAKTMPELRAVQKNLEEKLKGVQILGKMLKQIDHDNKKLDKEYASSKAFKNR